jgi:GxxExxY protein
MRYLKWVGNIDATCKYFLTAENKEKKIEPQRYMEENRITEIIIGCAIKVHKALGPGLLESAYEECLFYELSKTKLKIEKQKPLPLIYEEVKLECGYRTDIIVENKVVIEIKAVEALNDIHLAQVLTYLKLSKCKVGLLINLMY